MIRTDIPDDMKRCTGPCGLVLELDAFYEQAGCHKGRHPKCKKCLNAERKARNEEIRLLSRTKPVTVRLELGDGVAESVLKQPVFTAVETPADQLTDEQYLIAGAGDEPRRRAALAAILARAALKAKRSTDLAPSELAVRLELATWILDQIANGRESVMGSAIAQARQFIIVERGAGRYNRKQKT